MAAIDISLDNARKAYSHLNHISNHVLTPLLPLGTIQKGRVRLEVKVKPDHAGPMCTFKRRGAEWFLHEALRHWNGKKNLIPVGASAGNHAQGLSLAADRYGLEAHILMPKNVPAIKKSRVEGMRGVKVILEGEDFIETLERAKEYVKSDPNMVFVHPYEDQRIIEGQASVGVEILSQVCTSNSYLSIGKYMRRSELPDVIIVPGGGFGLASGLGSVCKEFNGVTGNDIKVIAVQTESADSMYQSWKSGVLRGSTDPKAETIADGINVKMASQIMLDTVRKYVDQVVAVSERAIKAGIYAASRHELLKSFSWESSEVETPHIPGRRLPNGNHQKYNHGNLSRLEGAAAAPLAAVLFGDRYNELDWEKIANGRDTVNVYCVLTGSNIDDMRFNRVIDEMSRDEFIQGRLADTLI